MLPESWNRPEARHQPRFQQCQQLRQPRSPSPTPPAFAGQPRPSDGEGRTLGGDSGLRHVTVNHGLTGLTADILARESGQG